MAQNAVVEDINQIFRARYSGRAYDPAREVSSHDLNAVFEAARWAPSGGNLQPWRYIVARKEDGEDCVMTKVWPPTAMPPARVAPVFAPTEKFTLPLPEPLAPLVTVIHPSVLTAVHAQPGAAATAKLPVTPDAATV